MIIHAGENKRILVEMLQADGTTPLNFTNVTALRVDFLQEDQPLKSISLTSSGFPVRAGTTATSFLIEITEGLSGTFVEGDLTIRCSIKVADVLFSASGGYQTCVANITDFTVSLP